jgi:hypothetical protein
VNKTTAVSTATWREQDKGGEQDHGGEHHVVEQDNGGEQDYTALSMTTAASAATRR